MEVGVKGQDVNHLFTIYKMLKNLSKIPGSSGSDPKPDELVEGRLTFLKLKNN